jgi:hypothetical protein
VSTRNVTARAASPPAGFPIERLNHLFATLPPLDKPDADAFLKEFAKLDRQLVPESSLLPVVAPLEGPP